MDEQHYNLVVLIVCYRSADLTIDALRSLEPEVQTVPGTHVIVCENGTGPESVEEIQNAICTHNWQDWVSIKVIHPNRGFAGGNNAVIRELLEWKTPPEFIMLLNSDTLVRPGALASMMRAACDHPEVGVIGPRLEWPDGAGQISCFRYLSPISEMLSAARTGPLTKCFHQWEVPLALSEEAMEPGWLSFACALIRRETFEAVGMLDDGYYLYFDDVDYCRRAWAQGWRVLYWPDAHVVHLRGRSNPVKEMTAARKRRPQYFYFSRNRYFAKFYGGRFGIWRANVLWHFGRMVALAREIVGHKKAHTCQTEWRDIWSNMWTPMRYEHVVKQQDLPEPSVDEIQIEEHAAA